MCKRSIDWLPLAYPQLGAWSPTQACALTRMELANFHFTGQHSIH